MWRGYSSLPRHGYVHRVVNHSDDVYRFVALYGTHTQRIEATWRPAKDWFRKRRFPTEQFADHLLEYLWRRDCVKRKIDPMEALLQEGRNQYSDFRNK
nr:unnamed protein product [Callosobruchus chinensis]